MKRLAILAAVVLAAVACSRGGDERKPHQVLEAGVAALAAGELAKARSELELAVAKADKAQIDWVRMKEYAAPLFQVYALQDERQLAAKIFDRVNRPQEEHYLYPREGGNLMALLARDGRQDEALLVARKLVHTLNTSGSHSPTLRMIVWGNIDRALYSAGEAEGATAAFEKTRAELENLARFRQGRHWPLEPGIRGWLERHASYLKVIGRGDEAAQVEALVAKIESNSPSPDAVPRCVAADAPPMGGCVLDVPVKALAVPTAPRS